MWLWPRVAVGVAGWTRGPLASVSGKDGSQCHAEGGVKSAVSPVGLVQVGASAEGVKMKQRRPRNGVARLRALRCAPPGLTAVPLPRGHGGPRPLRLTSREPEGAPHPARPPRDSSCARHRPENGELAQGGSRKEPSRSLTRFLLSLCPLTFLPSSSSPKGPARGSVQVEGKGG